MLLVDGFDEVDTITVLGTLRRVGLCVKTAAMTGGLICGAYGVWLKPDGTLTDLCDLVASQVPGVVILPESRPCLSKLEKDPRFHQVIEQVLARGGQIAAGAAGIRLAKRIATQGRQMAASLQSDCSGLIVREAGQPADGFASQIIRRLTE